MNRVVPASAVLILLVSLTAGAQAPASQPSQLQQLQQALAQKTQALGQCNAELGPLQQMQARAINGEIIAASQVKQLIEQANPGQTINEKFQLVAVTPPESAEHKDGAP